MSSATGAPAVQKDVAQEALEAKAREQPDPHEGWHLAKKGYDNHVAATMRDTAKSGRAAWPAAQNVGREWQPAAPLAPKTGFYDQRYLCKTLPTEYLEDDDAIRELFLGSEEEEGAKRVSFALKNVNDGHCDTISFCLKQKECKCESLWLNDNHITHTGAGQLAEALRDNTTLTELYLNYNALNDAGLRVLLVALEKNKTLRKLELGACGIGEEESGSENVAAKQIVLPFLSKNQTIQHVGLFGNSWKMEDDLPDIYRELEKRQDR